MRAAEDHFAFAQRVARRIARRCPPWVSVDDLVAASYLGAVEAMARTEPVAGPEVSHAAKTRIVGAILDELRRGDPLPRRVRARVRRAQHLRDRAGAAAVDDGDIAHALQIPLRHYRRDIAPLLRCEHVTFDDRRATGAAFDPDATIRARRLAAALTALAPRDRTVLDRVYCDGASFDEVARELGLSRVRVGQLHARALARLRAALAPAPPAPTGTSPAVHRSP